MFLQEELEESTRKKKRPKYMDSCRQFEKRGGNKCLANCGGIGSEGIVFLGGKLKS